MMRDIPLPVYVSLNLPPSSFFSSNQGRFFYLSVSWIINHSTMSYGSMSLIDERES